MTSIGSCIASNPDISGIGVRTAIYAQNILSFFPAIFALLDKKVSPTELETLETQSTTILITAFAILVSTIVQALTEGVTNYHAAIILNLSWMNNTNLFIYFLLYVHHRSGLRIENKKQDAESGQGVQDGELDESSDRAGTTRSIWISEITRALKNPVFIIGSLHLTLMAAVGVWLWSHPASFGRSPACSFSASLVILGRQVGLSSPGLRNWSLLIYSVLLTPILNLVIPIIFFLGPCALYNRYRPKPSPHILSITQISAGLAVLAIVDIIVLADTEIAIKKNKHLLLDGGDTVWTFGQTLALLLLLVPLRDLGEALLQRRPRKVGEKLMSASGDGKPEVVEHLLKQGPRAVTKDSNGQTPLHLAAAQGHTGVLKLLMNSGVSTTTKDRSDKAAIDLAIEGVHNDAVIHLLGGDVDAEETSGQKAIHWVAAKGILDVLKHLISSGATVNEYDSLGRTPLHLAAGAGRLDIVECLIEHGAEVNAKDRAPPIPPHVPSESGRDQNEYARQGTSSDSDSGSDVEYEYDSTSQSDSDHSSASIEDPTCSALCLAASQGYLNIVKCLLKHGADVENDRTFGSPLYRAIQGGHTDVVRCLVEHGAEVNIYGSGGYTPLSFAVGAGHTDIVKCLAQNGAYLDERLEESQNSILTCPRGISILRRAVKAGQTDIVKCLVEHGASMANEDFSKNSLVHVAAEAGYLDIVRFLVANGASADVNGKTYHGLTPLGRAVELGRIETVKCLIELGAKVNQKYKLIVGYHSGREMNLYGTGTALHSAARKGFIKTIERIQGMT